MKKLLLTLTAAICSLYGQAQIAITATGSPYLQNFNSLSDTGLNNPYSTLPNGWKASETGTGANTFYRAANGSLAGGDLYSFGDSTSTERALGTVASGTVAPVYFGAAFVNNTGSTVQNVRLSFHYELWRVGNPTRSTGPDTLVMEWAKGGSNLMAGNYTMLPNSSFISPAPATATQNVPVNGNGAANQVSITDTLHNLNLAAGDTLWLRWTDANSASFDDGMGLDDFSLTMLATAPPPTSTSGFISLAGTNASYYQSFDSLGYTYTNHLFTTLPNGWYGYEWGGDNAYNPSYGELAGGKIYSFGDSSTTERALGSVGSGSVYRSDYGAAFINNTSQTIQNIQVSYMGEQWRMGRPARPTGPDTLHFSYSKHAKAIADTAAIYQSVSQLNFFAPITNGTLNTPLNGNAAANRTFRQGLLSNLNLPAGDTLWIRWTDFDSNSFDDGLGIDSVTVAVVTPVSLLNMEFAQKSTHYNERQGTVQLPVVIHNKSAYLSQAEVFVADSGNVDFSRDLSLTPGYVYWSPATTDSIANFSFTLNSNEPFEGDEYFVLGLRNPANGILGAITRDTVWIHNYTFPSVTLSTLATETANGIADSLGLPAQIEGIVHSENYSLTGGLNFYMQDATGGINIYQVQWPAAGYQPQVGDKLRIWGQVSQFRGLTRMEGLDSVQLLATAQPLYTPQPVSAVNEATESKYLQLTSVRLVPAVAQWPANLKVQAVNQQSGDTFFIYVPSQSNLSGTAAPTGTFTIRGIGTQFAPTTTTPFVGGYELVAIDNALTPAAINQTVVPESRITLYPNPFTDFLKVESRENMLQIEVYRTTGERVAQYTPAASRFTLDTHSWTAGMYLIRITQASGVWGYKTFKK